MTAKDRQQPPPPTLEHMLYEHKIVLGLLDLVQKRIARGVKVPDYIWKSAHNLGEAYLMTVKEFFPETMSAQYEEVEKELDRLIGMYEARTEAA